MERPLSFGDWLQQRRKALGLTRAQLARRVGYSVSALRKIETGERRPSSEAAELLANSLELTPEARSILLKVARGEQTVERLPLPGPAEAPRPVEQRPAPAVPQLNLPVHATPLVGRQAELAEIGRLLGDTSCRLLTLVGPGGIGKTRLAIRAARQVSHTFAHGAVFVALAPLNSSSFVIPAMADALGYGFSGPVDPQAQLLSYLRDKELLIVLDNAEHLLADGAAELLAELLQHAPSVKLMVTSREVLNVQAEWVFAVQGLPIPGGGMPGPEAEGGAVELFLQRAQRAHVGFVPRPEDYQAIVRICQLVEGMPLALELAAAWVRTLSCAEIAQEIECNPARLSVSVRDLPARHRSLSAVFAHSWELLSAQEQSVLMKLSVFRGGFTREAAEQVAGATLEVLSALGTKSLLRGGGTGRYDLHELIRQYARERLNEAGLDDLGRQAHATWFLSFARTAQAHMYTQSASAWLNTVEQEHHNVREVLRWALEPGAREAVAIRLTTGMGLMCALVDFFFVRGHHHEALAYFEQLLAHPEAETCMPEVVETRIQASYFYYLQDRLAEAQAALDKAFERDPALDQRDRLARGLEYRGLIFSAEGRYALARAALEQSLVIWRELKAGFQQAEVLGHLADIALAEHNHDLAEQLYTQAIDPSEDMPYGVRHPYPPRRLAYLVLRRGDCARAIDLVRQSLRLNLAIHDSRAVAACLVALASVARVQAQLPRAARLCGAAEGILSSIAASLLPADREEYDRNVEALKLGLGESDLTAAWDEGRSLGLSQAVEYARQDE